VKNHADNRVRVVALPTILAAMLAIFWAVSPARAAEVKLTRADVRTYAITGGAGANAWALRYHTPVNGYWDYRSKQLVEIARLLPVEGDRAWFSHGGWLRLIDTKQGVVIGRWHFPGLIVRLEVAGKELQVETQQQYGPENLIRTVFPFDPAAPRIPNWPPNDISLERLSQTESDANFTFNPGNASAQDAKQREAQMKDMVRRDPLSPWLRVALGKFLLETSQPGATDVFREAVELASTDFTELLRISAFLDTFGQREVARKAFERGYRDFLERGYDPRLVHSLLPKFILYSYGPAKGDWKREDPVFRREIIERFYRFAPYAEAAEYAWQLYAQRLETDGPSELVSTWQFRAKDARGKSGAIWNRGVLLAIDTAALLVASAFLAGFLFIVVIYRRYVPQRRLLAAAHGRQGKLARGFFLFGLEFWSRRDRIAFLSIALLGWLAAGAVGSYMSGILRVAAAPLSLAGGSLAGPVNREYLEKHLPPTPERDLLLAYSWQLDGDLKKAEELYRALPQFAESWNNLGVILNATGRESQAKQAFEHALQMDPARDEAAVNSGRPAQSFWTKLFQENLPGKPMLALPASDRFQRAYLNGSTSAVMMRAVAGPLTYIDNDPSLIFGSAGAARGTILFVGLLVAVTLLAIAMVTLIPARDVTQPPGRRHIVLQILFPGTVPAWSWFGGLVLTAWSFFFIQDLLLFWQGSSRILTYISMPNILWAYGVPAEPNAVRLTGVGGLINPGWGLVAVSPAILFAVNLALVLWQRRRERSVSVG